MLYEIKIDNDGDGEEDVSYQFRFHTTVANPNTFLYNTGPITSLTDPDWNMPPVLQRDRGIDGNNHVQARQQPGGPPANIGPRSTPNYSALATARRLTTAAAHSSSPGRATTRSMWTSARSSTWPACARSTRCT